MPSAPSCRLKSLIAAPPDLTAIQAASIWMQYFTAFGIVEAGRAALGDYVLIPAASSSVGLAAIQIANWVGAEPIALTRTSAKANALLELGARHVIASTESRCRRRSNAHHRRQGRARGVRSGRWSLCRDAGQGHGGRRHTDDLRRTQWRAIALPALVSGHEGPEPARLGRIPDLEQAATLRGSTGT